MFSTPIVDIALLYAGLGFVYWQYANLGLQQAEAIAKAEAYAEQALRLDPETAQAYALLGLVSLNFRGNQRQAARHLRHALSIAPNDSAMLAALLYIDEFSGKTSAAWSLADRVMSELSAIIGNRIFGQSKLGKIFCISVAVQRQEPVGTQRGVCSGSRPTIQYYSAGARHAAATSVAP